MLLTPLKIKLFSNELYFMSRYGILIVTVNCKASKKEVYKSQHKFPYNSQRCLY